MEEALALDPEFVEAWARLSAFHMVYYANGLDKTDARLARARKALRRAEELDPNHPETLFARGSYYYYGFSNYEQALKEFVAATERAPSHALARLQVGNIHRRLGNWDACVENQEAAVLLDPQSGNIASQLVVTYRGQRRYEDAVRLL